MRRLKFILPFCLSCLFLLSFLKPQNSFDRVDTVKTNLLSSMQGFEESILFYAETVDAYIKENKNIEELQRAHLDCRLAVKQTETYLFYFQPEAIKKYINGAPLPMLEKNTSSLVVFEPKGLQTLDELVFDEETDMIEIQSLILEMKKEFEKIKLYQKGIKLYDYSIYEAMRSQLIRVFTQGVTGFDTPGSLAGLEESKIVLEGLKVDFMVYDELVSPSLYSSIMTHFDLGIKQLASSDFETFDRLYFLMNCINPLYGDLLQAQISLGVELPHEQQRAATAVNYMAANIFDTDFLNSNYFAQVDEVELSAQRVELGRLLFFDPVLSKDNNGSCASCHDPGRGFSDGQAMSKAFNGDGDVNRNAPGLINSVLADRYFHDLRASELKFQLDHVVFSEKEFNTNYNEIIERLSGSKAYLNYFASAYPDRKSPMSAETVKLAINEYVASLVALNSTFDRFVKGEISQLDPRVRNGFNLFMGKASCGTCHFAPIFNGSVPPDFEESESEVLGVPSTKEAKFIDGDIGRYGNKVEKEKADHYRFSFKTPSVRNIALTAPYMHNGVYDDLLELMTFYNKGGGSGHGFDVPGQTLGADPLGLTDIEIGDIILFMESLTDEGHHNKWPDSLPSFEAHPEWDSRYESNY